MTVVNVMKEVEKRRKENQSSADNNNNSSSTNSNHDKEDENLCKICFEAHIDAVIVPCGHVSICMVRDL